MRTKFPHPTLHIPFRPRLPLHSFPKFPKTLSIVLPDLALPSFDRGLRIRRLMIPSNVMPRKAARHHRTLLILKQRHQPLQQHKLVVDTKDVHHMRCIDDVERPLEMPQPGGVRVEDVGRDEMVLRDDLLVPEERIPVLKVLAVQVRAVHRRRRCAVVHEFAGVLREHAADVEELAAGRLQLLEDGLVGGLGGGDGVGPVLSWVGRSGGGQIVAGEAEVEEDEEADRGIGVVVPGEIADGADVSVEVLGGDLAVAFEELFASCRRGTLFEGEVEDLVFGSYICRRRRHLDVPVSLLFLHVGEPLSIQQLYFSDYLRVRNAGTEVEEHTYLGESLRGPPSLDRVYTDLVHYIIPSTAV